MEKLFPKGWVETQLVDLLQTLESGTRPKGGVQGILEGVPSIGGEHLASDGGFSFKNVKYIPTQFAEKLSRGRIFKNDILVVKDGATTGKTSFVDKTFPFDLAFVNEHVFICRPSSVINSKILFYFMRSKIGQDRIMSNFAGAAQGGINTKFASNTLTPLPPLAEQERIVAKLDKLFAQHEKIKGALDRIPQLLKSFRQQVLTQAVTGKLTSLKDVGVWKGGGTPSKSNSAFWENGDILWITAKDMKGMFLEDSLDKITLKGVDGSSANLIPVNSILMVTRSGILRRILPISTNQVETTVNQDLKVLIPRDEYYYKYLLFALNGREKDIRNKCMKSGTTVESIEFELLKNYQLAIPPLQEQHEIVSRVESLFTKADAIEARYNTLKAKIESLPQTILHKAFKGELIPQLPTDGDAKDLLAEILALKKEVKGKKRRE